MTITELIEVLEARLTRQEALVARLGEAGPARDAEIATKLQLTLGAARGGEPIGPHVARSGVLGH